MNIFFVCLYSVSWQEKPSLFLKNPYHHCVGLNNYISIVCFSDTHIEHSTDNFKTVSLNTPQSTSQKALK